MKKAVSFLICLVMLLTGVAAAAEEAVSQAALQSAFTGKINEFFAGMGPGKNLSFHVSPEGSQPLTGVLSVIADEEGQELDDLTILLPGQEKPVQVQFSKAEQTIYAKYQDRVFALRISDLQEMLQSLTSMFFMPTIDPQISKELSLLFMTNVIMPGVKTENNQGVITLRVDLKAKDVAAGLARFVDQVMATEKYWDAVKPLLRFIGMRQRLSYLSVNQYMEDAGDKAPTGDFAEAFEKNWPKLKEQLLALESDARLTADAIIRTVAESGTTAVVAKITYSQNGQSAVVTLSAADNRKNLELGLTLATQLGGVAEPVTQATLDVKCDKQAGNLNAVLTLPNDHIDVKLTGSMTRRGGDLAIQGHLSVSGNTSLTADAEIFSVDGNVTANVQVTANSMTVTGNLFWSKFVKTLTVNAQGQTLKAEIRSDEEGNFSAGLTLPGSQGKFLAEGHATDSSLHCTVTYSDMRALMRGGAPAFSAEVTAAWSSLGLSANVTVMSGGKVYAGQAYIGRSAQKISYQGGEYTLVLDFQEDSRAQLTLGRVTYTDAKSSRSSFEITYTPDAVVYEDARQKITVTDSYTSETEYVIDAEVVDKSREGVYNAYADGEGSVDVEKADSGVSHAYIRTRLIEEENRIELTVENVMGQTALTAGVAIQPVGEIALLSQQEPIYITAELLQQLAADPSALEKLLQPAEEEQAEGAPAETVEAPVVEEPAVEAPVDAVEEPAAGSSFLQQLVNGK